MRPDRAVVKKALSDTDGDKVKAAALLGCSRQTLYNWIYTYGLERYAGISLDTRREVDRRLRKDTRGVKENPIGHEGQMSNQQSTNASSLRLVEQAAAATGDYPVQATIRVRGSLWRRMKIEAIRRGVTVTALAEAAFEQALIEHKRKESGK